MERASISFRLICARDWARSRASSSIHCFNSLIKLPAFTGGDAAGRFAQSARLARRAGNVVEGGRAETDARHVGNRRRARGKRGARTLGMHNYAQRCPGVEPVAPPPCQAGAGEVRRHRKGSPPCRNFHASEGRGKFHRWESALHSGFSPLQESLHGRGLHKSNAVPPGPAPPPTGEVATATFLAEGPMKMSLRCARGAFALFSAMRPHGRGPLRRARGAPHQGFRPAPWKPSLRRAWRVPPRVLPSAVETIPAPRAWCAPPRVPPGAVEAVPAPRVARPSTGEDAATFSAAGPMKPSLRRAWARRQPAKWQRRRFWRKGR